MRLGVTSLDVVRFCEGLVCEVRKLDWRSILMRRLFSGLVTPRPEFDVLLPGREGAALLLSGREVVGRFGFSLPT